MLIFLAYFEKLPKYIDYYINIFSLAKRIFTRKLYHQVEYPSNIFSRISFSIIDKQNDKISMYNSGYLL